MIDLFEIPVAETPDEERDGEIVEGRVLRWEVWRKRGHNRSHLLAEGPPGSGKTILARTLLAHTKAHPEIWESRHIDVTGLPSPLPATRTASGRGEALEALRAVEAGVAVRLETLRDDGANGIYEHYEICGRRGEPAYPLVLVVVEGAETDPAAVAALQRTARLGAAAGVYLAVLCSTPRAFPGPLRYALGGTRLALSEAGRCVYDDGENQWAARVLNTSEEVLGA